MAGRDVLERLEREAARAPLDPTPAGRVADRLLSEGKIQQGVAWKTWEAALIDRVWRLEMRAAGREPGLGGAPIKSKRVDEAEAEVAALIQTTLRRRRSEGAFLAGLVEACGAREVSVPQPGLIFAKDGPNPDLDIKQGDMIELVDMPGDPDPLPKGAKGLVTGVVPSMDIGSRQVWVEWQDSTRTLALEMPPDVVEVVGRAPAAAVGTFRGQTVVIEAAWNESGWLRALNAQMLMGVPCLERRTTASLAGTKGVMTLNVHYVRGGSAKASMYGLDGSGVRAYMQHGQLTRNIVLGADPEYYLTLMWLFGRVLRPMPEDMSGMTKPWRPEP